MKKEEPALRLKIMKEEHKIKMQKLIQTYYIYICKKYVFKINNIFKFVLFFILTSQNIFFYLH